jgi:hypothetical protein
VNTRIALKFAALVALLASSALAHHSTAVNFNRDSIISIKGVITEYRFQNPHVQILVDVTNEDGETEAWMVELAAKNQFIRSGWVGNEFVAGQIITVFGWEGYRPRSTYFQRAIMEDGTEVVAPSLLTGRAGGPAGGEPQLPPN